MNKEKSNINSMDKIISLCKRRGFIFPSAEIYGGLRSTYDYGPLGVELKNNIKKAWWRRMVQERQDVVGLDSAILTPEIVWQASGHLENFTDPLVECKKCHQRFRQDELEQRDSSFAKKRIQNDSLACPECGGELTQPQSFNLLMKTQLGVVEGKQDDAYLRGETCQGIYLNYLNIKDSMRLKMPFGIAQIGKAFRNEITPGNFIFRMREFEQMEMQYFVNPQEAKKYYKTWKDWTMDWYQEFIQQPKNLRWRQHEKDELAHYAKEAWDVEYKTPFDGWKEFAGVHNRGDWDLSRHSQFSKQDLSYMDLETKEKFIPWVQEVSMGVDRAMLMFLVDAYTEVETRSGDEDSKHETEVVLKLHPELAPIKIAILPLSKKEPLQKLAQQIFDDLKQNYKLDYDETTSIGKRYRRQDEIGTPYCLTIDFESLDDQAVTIRDRDTMQQERIKIAELKNYFQDKF
ncbi:MAG: glycine--tRNA ligase [Patescibacteria group bacterium]|nr:glycine--tRNA ligase [Patescibacteria group bacterium]